MSDLELDGAGVSVITDHPFTPRGEWYEVCCVEVAERADPRGMPGRWRPCGLAEAAHQTSTLARGEERDA